MNVYSLQEDIRDNLILSNFDGKIQFLALSPLIIECIHANFKSMIQTCYFLSHFVHESWYLCKIGLRPLDYSIYSSLTLGRTI